MGGFSYDRDVYGSDSSSGWNPSSSYSSSAAASAMNARTLCSDMKPCDKVVKSYAKHPIIILFDVTGSNIEFAKITYDKMPMLYGQIEQKGYLTDFEILVGAIGDANCDDYPLQIGEFSKGIEIDSWLKKIVLERGGGGQKRESYELAAYFLLKNFEFQPDAEPVVFFLGDEAPYSSVDSYHIQHYICSEYKEASANTGEVFDALLRKVPNTYLFLNPYGGISQNEMIENEWKNIFHKFPKHIIHMQPDNEKSIVDLMLGVIAMVGKNSFNSYKIDMENRGQTASRISCVENALKDISTELAVIPDAAVANIPHTGKDRQRSNHRI